MPHGTRFHLLRHAQTDLLGRTLAGRSGPGLNAKGVSQAEALAATLAGLDATALISSPQLRTRQTADAVSQVIDRPVQTDAALDEIDFGAWTGCSFDDLAQLPAWQAWNTQRSLAPTPGGETMLSAQARAVALLQRLHIETPGGVFVLVSHADIIKAMLAYALGMPVDLMQRVEISPASRSVILLRDSDLRIEAVNWTD